MFPMKGCFNLHYNPYYIYLMFVEFVRRCVVVQVESGRVAKINTVVQGGAKNLIKADTPSKKVCLR